MAGKRPPRSVAPRQPVKVSRRIYFYKISLANDLTRSPLIDVPAALRSIHALPMSAPRCQEPDEDARLWASVCGESPHLRCCLTALRLHGLPQAVRVSGDERALPIDDDEGLGEKTHFVLFDNHVLGTEFNFYGPRVEVLPSYLDALAQPLGLGPIPHIRLTALVRGDVLDEVAADGEAVMLTLRVKPEVAGQLRQVSDALGAALESLAQVGDPQEVELVLRSKPRSSERLNGVMTTIRDLLKKNWFRSSAKKMEVKIKEPGNRRMTAIDLLSDRLVANVVVDSVGDRGRAVNPTQMFGAIETAYEERRADIEAATGIQT